MLLSACDYECISEHMFAGEGGTDLGGDTATKVCRFQQATTMGFLQCGGL